MENQIQVFQGNTAAVICTVTGLENLTDYIATLTVKWNIDETAVLIKVGSIAELIITFNIDSDENDLAPGNYVYDIMIAKPITDKEPIEYTIVKGVYTVNDGVKN